MLTMQTAKIERLENELRRRCAKAATMPVRGFDTRKAKDDELAEIDRVLDELAAARAKAAHDAWPVYPVDGGQVGTPPRLRLDG